MPAGRATRNWSPSSTRRGQALSTAAAFEIDDVIDPADTRAVLTDVLARVTGVS